MGKRQYPRRRPTAVDLFCGAGGMSLGFEQAGFDVVLGVDTDGHHIAAHHRNFPKSKTICGSVSDLTGDQIRKCADLRADLDLLFGGPPCQGFSHMGLRDKKDPRNSLVNEFVRIALELLPRSVVMENVPGILSESTRPLLDAAIADLSQEYNVTEPVRVLNAADFGVPQNRKRVIVLAVRKDQTGTVCYPQGPCPGQPQRPSVDEAITDLPDVDADDTLFRQDVVPYDKAPTSVFARVARGVLVDITDLSVPRKWDRAVCSGCTRTRHTRATIELYKSTPPGMTVPGHKLPRLDPDGICPTLRAGSDSSRGSYTSPRPIHPQHPRCITVREAARLHGYPDWFRFVPIKWHAYKQIGNSVCPPVARAVGHQLLAILRPARTTVPPRTVSLSDNFVLPKNAPKRKRRIPQLREFPPVISYLFCQAFDKASGRLWRERFSFSDVKAAIKEIGSNLPWVRGDTFLQEVARSRSVQKILQEPLRYGFTITIEKEGDFIGKFVPTDTPGTIEKKDDAGIKTAELSNAVDVHLSASCLVGFDKSTAAEFLSDADVRTSVWTDSVVSVEIVENVTRNGKAFRHILSVKRCSGRKKRALLIIGTEGNVPPRSRVVRAASETGQEEVVVATPVTARHILVSRYIRATAQPKEVSRAVFSLNGRNG